jgi:hypothetical protein
MMKISNFEELKQLLKILNEQNVKDFELDGLKLQLIPSGPQRPPSQQTSLHDDENIDDDLLFYSSENN